MARNKKKLRGIFEMPPDSGIFYIQYFDINGNRHREKVGLPQFCRRAVEKPTRLVRSCSRSNKASGLYLALQQAHFCQ
jgi:hypothetical protein